MLRIKLSVSDCVRRKLAVLGCDEKTINQHIQQLEHAEQKRRQRRAEFEKWKTTPDWHLKRVDNVEIKHRSKGKKNDQTPSGTEGQTTIETGGVIAGDVLQGLVSP